MIIFGNLRRKIPLTFLIFFIGILISKQIVPTSLVSFQLMTSTKRYVEISMQSFYVMFPAIMYVLHLEKHKMQNIRNHNINTEK